VGAATVPQPSGQQPSPGYTTRPWMGEPGPPAPPPPQPAIKTKHTLRSVVVIVFIAIIIIIIAVDAASQFAPAGGTKIHLTAAEVTTPQGSSPGPAGYASCPSTVTGGSNFVCQAHVNNTGTTSMSIATITVTSSADIYGDLFTHVSSTPALPSTVPAGGSVAFSVTITAPSSVPPDSSTYVTVINIVFSS
jgi:hypothetical protein